MLKSFVVVVCSCDNTYILYVAKAVLSACTVCIGVLDGTVKHVVWYKCRTVGILVFEQGAGSKAPSAELLVCV